MVWVFCRASSNSIYFFRNYTLGVQGLFSVFRVPGRGLSMFLGFEPGEAWSSGVQSLGMEV